MVAPPGFAFEIRPQPDDASCGPTCLHAVYHHWGDAISLEQVIAEAPALEGGGTLAAMLGCHALERGYRARLFTFNLSVFDPTWFGPDAPPLSDKLTQRAAARADDSKLRLAAEHYRRFLELGGAIDMHDLSRDLLRKPLVRGVPIITGLSSTYLYQEARLDPSGSEFDDVGGDPQGHFVVLSGYDRKARQVAVADPWFPSPVSKTGRYQIGVDRVASAILLGVLTYDANLLIIEPAPRRRRSAP